MKMKDCFTLVEVGDEYFAVNVNRTEGGYQGIIQLNETGKLIWDGIANGKDERAIVSDLMDQYEVDEQTASESVTRILRQMIDAGIVEE